MKINKGYANLRKGRKNLPHHAYHITFVTKHRKPVFNDFFHATVMRLSLQSSDKSNLTETMAFCIMPDHVHWLFLLKNDSLSRVVSRAKAMFSRSLKKKLWQEGFYDHGIRSDESLKEIARYIVANPLRAKLVDSIGEYPHWDATWL